MSDTRIPSHTCDNNTICRVCGCTPLQIYIKTTDTREGEPAYTPRKEYTCDSNTTHYMGCRCHEERHEADKASLRDELEGYLSYKVQATNSIKLLTEGTHQLVAEAGQLRERLERAEKLLAFAEDAPCYCEGGHSDDCEFTIGLAEYRGKA